MPKLLRCGLCGERLLELGNAIGDILVFCEITRVGQHLPQNVTSQEEFGKTWAGLRIWGARMDLLGSGCILSTHDNRRLRMAYGLLGDI